MKKILTCIVLAFAASGLVGCYEDKSTYATDQIPDFVLTDTATTEFSPQSPHVAP